MSKALSNLSSHSNVSLQMIVSSIKGILRYNAERKTINPGWQNTMIHDSWSKSLHLPRQLFLIWKLSYIPFMERCVDHRVNSSMRPLCSHIHRGKVLSDPMVLEALLLAWLACSVSFVQSRDT